MSWVECKDKTCDGGKSGTHSHFVSQPPTEPTKECTCTPLYPDPNQAAGFERCEVHREQRHPHNSGVPTPDQEQGSGTGQPPDTTSNPEPRQNAPRNQKTPVKESGSSVVTQSVVQPNYNTRLQIWEQLEMMAFVPRNQDDATYTFDKEEILNFVVDMLSQPTSGQDLGEKS